MNERYWLRVGDLSWQEATQEQFVRAEKGCGFYPKPGCGPVATGGFSSGETEGRVTYGEITAEKYPDEPEFVALANKTTVAP